MKKPARRLYWYCSACGVLEPLHAAEGYEPGDREPCVDCHDGVSVVYTMKEIAALQWRCFHCQEVFTDARAARSHFGTPRSYGPKCRERPAFRRAVGPIITVLRDGLRTCSDPIALAGRALEMLQELRGRRGN